MASWPPRSWTRNTSGRTWRTAASRSTSKNCRPEDLRGTYLYLEVRTERCHLLRTSVKYAPGGLALSEDGVIAPNRTLTAIRGVQVGHAEDLRRRTGCSVVLLTPPAMAFADARGGWPGTYDTAASDLGKTFIERHALLLTGRAVLRNERRDERRAREQFREGWALDDRSHRRDELCRQRLRLVRESDDWGDAPQGGRRFPRDGRRGRGLCPSLLHAFRDDDRCRRDGRAPRS